MLGHKEDAIFGSKAEKEGYTENDAFERLAGDSG